MVQDVSHAPTYDFSRLCHLSRLVQLGCLALQMCLIYSEYNNLSYFEISIYMSLCAVSFYLVFNRWRSSVDGRFDLEQLMNVKDVKARIPYAVALFSGVLIAFLTWSFVSLENGFVHFIFHLLSAVDLIAAAALLGLEFYEVFVTKTKSK